MAGIRILVVEDNNLNQQVMAELLRITGASVDTAGNGTVAVEKVRGGQYDLVFMDLQMPVMDGLTAAREIRKLPGLAKLPIIAMTANARKGNCEYGPEAGMNDHVAKPIDQATLLSIVHKWIPTARALKTAGNGADSPASRFAFLCDLPQIDAATGVRLALGKEDLYISLLWRFAAGQKGFPEAMAAARAQDDWCTAERLAHTLKGTAAQIGAMSLSAAAGRLEAAIRRQEKGNSTDWLQAEVARDLSLLVQALTSCLPQPARPEAAEESVDKNRLHGVCIRLAEQLADNDCASSTTLEENRPLLRAGLGNHFPWIAEAVHTCNFEAALDWLLEAIQGLGFDLPPLPDRQGPCCQHALPDTTEEAGKGGNK